MKSLMAAACLLAACGSDPAPAEPQTPDAKVAPLPVALSPEFEQEKAEAPEVSTAAIRGRSEGLPHDRSLNKDDVQELLAAAAQCPLSVDAPGPLWLCAPFRKLREAGWHRDSEPKRLAALARQVGGDALRHQRPGNRAVGARILQWQGLARTDETVQAQLVSAFVAEKNPAVALVMLDALEGAPAKGNLERAYTRALRSPVPTIQQLAAEHLATGPFAPSAGLAEVVEEVAADGAGLGARAAACLALGRMTTEPVVARIVRLFEKPLPPVVGEGCARGLVAAWAGMGTRPLSPQKLAYEQTLKLLAETQNPALTPRVLRSIGRAFASKTEADRAWQEAAPFVAHPALVVALLAVVEDPDRAEAVRVAALESAVRLGMSADQGAVTQDRLEARGKGADAAVADALSALAPD